MQENQRFLSDAGKEYQATLRRFNEFVDAIVSIELPTLQFHPWTRRETEIGFDFLGAHHVIRYAFRLDEAGNESTIRLLRVGDESEPKCTPVRHVYVNSQGKVKSEPREQWIDGLPGRSEELFYYMLTGRKPDMLPRVPARNVM